MQAAMNAQIATQGTMLLVKVTGVVDIDTSPLLHDKVFAAWTPDLTRMELDFSGVDYISSPGIALLLEFRHMLQKQNAEVVLVAASKQVREVLAMCRLDSMFLPDCDGGTTVPAAG
jgi:anti-anti-sigma factor